VTNSSGLQLDSMGLPVFSLLAAMVHILIRQKLKVFLLFTFSGTDADKARKTQAEN
jgi:hypothetical protein